MAERLELRTLALIRTRSNYLRFKFILKEDYFSDRYTKIIFKTIRNLHEKYNKPLLQIRDLIDYSQIPMEKPDDRKEVKKVLRTIKRLSQRTPDPDVSNDIVTHFLGRRAAQGMVLETLRMLETDESVDWTAIKEKVEVASGISVVSPDYVNYFEIDHDKRKKTGRKPLPTLISEELDLLMGGGVGIGEMALIEGVPGVGKTTWLMNVGKGALEQGKKVLHISAELTGKVVRRRYDETLLECTFEQLQKADDRIFKKLDTLEKAGGLLIIKDMASIRCKVGDIRSFLDAMYSKGLHFDVIIMDYADLLEPSRSYKEKRHELDEIYRDLRRAANEFRTRMWTASKASKKSLDRRVAGLESLAEDWGKGFIVDFLMSWNETEDEHEEGFCRIFLAKNREGRINKTIRCSVDFDRMLIRGIEHDSFSKEKIRRYCN